MADEKELLTNPPFYDLNEATESYGLDLDEFKKNNFEEFITNIITEYILLRKSYIMKDLTMFRQKAHKIKGISM